MATPRIEFDSNLRSDEDEGRESMYLERSGSSRDLRNESKVLIEIDWNSSTLTPEDIYFDRDRADGDEITTISDKGRIIGILVTFPSGEDRVRIPWYIIDDKKYEDNERLNLELSSIKNANITDDDAYIKVYDNDDPLELDVKNAGYVDEGGRAVFTLQLSEAADEDVRVRVRTSDRDTEAGKDYETVDEWVTIRAGQTTATVSVNINTDKLRGEEDEKFYLEAVDIRGGDAVINDDSGYAYVVNKNADLSATLQIHKDVIDALVSESDIETAGRVIKDSSVLFQSAAILQSEGALPDGLWEEVNPSGQPWGGDADGFLGLNWSFGSLGHVINAKFHQFTGNFFTNTVTYQREIEERREDAGPVKWTAEQVESADGAGLEAGHYVDGRLVIHQPLIGFESDGDQFVFSSSQGRYEFGGDPGEIMGSHKKTDAHSFDWGGIHDLGNVTVYVVAPADGYIIYADDSGGVNGGFGNLVTMVTNAVDGNGDPIYLSFTHLKGGTVPNRFTEDLYGPRDVAVKAGEIIGVVGDTGAAYKTHLHMGVGNQPRTLLEGAIIANASEENGTDGSSVKPPVFMLFGDANISERYELAPGIEIEDGLGQDYGFPIGDTDPGDPLVVSDIESTFTLVDFKTLNGDLAKEFGFENTDWFTA